MVLYKAKRNEQGIPLGLTKWITDSSWKMLTSSIPGMTFTPSLFKVLCSLLSSVVVVLWTAFFFLRTKYINKVRNKSDMRANMLWHRRTQTHSPMKECMNQNLQVTSSKYEAWMISTNLLTLPFPPVRTALAIFISFSLFICFPTTDSKRLNAIHYISLTPVL